MMPILHRLMANQNAATLIEYSPIVCLLAIAAIGGMTKVGQGVLGPLGSASNNLR